MATRLAYTVKCSVREGAEGAGSRSYQLVRSCLTWSNLSRLKQHQRRSYIEQHSTALPRGRRCRSCRRLAYSPGGRELQGRKSTTNETERFLHAARSQFLFKIDLETFFLVTQISKALPLLLRSRSCNSSSRWLRPSFFNIKSIKFSLPSSSPRGVDILTTRTRYFNKKTWICCK